MSEPARQAAAVARTLAALCLAAGLCSGFAARADGDGPTAANAAADADAANPFAGSKEAANKGEELFSRNCQQCHNSRGKGGKGPQLVRGAWGPGGSNTDLTMYRIIAGGRPGTEMGSFATGLSGDEIWQIVTFLRAEARRVKAAAAKSSGEDDLF